MMFVDCRSDDEIRLSRLILATLNRDWAYHPNISWDDTDKYIRRANHAFNSVDKHQHKDSSCRHQIIFPIAPVNLTDLQEI